MKLTVLGAVIGVGLLASFATTPAAASCCDHSQKSACCEQHLQSCCKHPDDPIAKSVLLPNLDEPRPVRERLVVWFHKPVKVGDRILQGKYIIEHDNDRMAHGGPCTYIYAASDQQLPVVAFFCTHLERPLAGQPTVVLRPLGEANGMKELVAFQFAGEMGAHGVPVNR
jgi:hypothetical protein